MLITLVAPSRGRPVAFEQMVRSALDHAAHPEKVEVRARLDDDDPELDHYLWLVEDLPHCRAVAAAPAVMSGLWNDGAAIATGDILMLAADDLRFRTRGWDAMVREEFERWPDRLVVVWGPDGNVNGQRCTHPFVHRRWVEVTGHFTPSIFVADYADHWIYDVACRVNRLAELPDLFIEHMHVSLGKSPEDDTERQKCERARVAGQRPVELWEATAFEREWEAKAVADAIAAAAV